MPLKHYPKERKHNSQKYTIQLKSYLNKVIRDLFEIINFDHLRTILNEHQIKINEYKLKMN